MHPIAPRPTRPAALFRLAGHTREHPSAFSRLIQKNRHIKLAGNEKLRIEKELPSAVDRAQMVRDVLRSLGQPKVAETST
jgi:hypothetical protein